MKIALVGPMTLELLEPMVGSISESSGYPFVGTSELALSYWTMGHDLTLITTAPDISRPITRSGERCALVVIPSRPSARERALDLFADERKAIVQAVRSSGADVVHAHWTYEFGLSALQSGVPALVTCHDWAPAIARKNRHPYWRFRQLMQWLCLRKAEHLSAPSEYIADRIRRRYRKECAVVPNGIDLESFTPRRKIRRNAIGAMNVGFSKRKNVAALLRAWPRLRQTFPGLQLDLAGPDYEPEGPANRWAVDHELSTEGINFLGPIARDHVPMWFQSLKVFVHPSVEESFGIVLVEAMAAGTPIVCSDSAGGGSSLTEDVARQVDVSSPAAIARAIEEVLIDPTTAATMAVRGAQRAKLYSMRSSSRSYLSLLDEVLESGVRQ